MAEVSKVRDKNGKLIDRTIRPIVTALRAAGFDTTASCSGHIGGGEPFPWIDIGVRVYRSADHQSENGRRDQNLKSANREQLSSMLEFLGQFYQDRKTPFWSRLVLLPVGMFGGFQLVAQGSGLQAGLRKQTRRLRLRVLQAEFRAFGDFVRAQVRR